MTDWPKWKVLTREERLANLTKGKDIKSFSNNCHLIAGANVSGIDHEVLKETWLKHGWRPGEGMRPMDYHAALAELGFHVVKVPFKDRQNCTTLGALRKAFPKGTYLVGTIGHVFVLRDGVYIDSNVGGKMRRYVCDVHLVPNAAPYVPGNRLRMVVHPGWRKSQGAERRRQAYEWVRMYWADHKTWPTKAEWLENTPLKEADIRYDIERSKMEWVH